jgi:hypothetical protein
MVVHTDAWDAMTIASFGSYGSQIMSGSVANVSFVYGCRDQGWQMAPERVRVVRNRPRAAESYRGTRSRSLGCARGIPMLAAIRASGFGLLLLFVGCATGTKPGAIADDDDDGVSIDAPSSPADARQVAPDAPVSPADAPVSPPDAFVPQDAPAQPPDAASPFCASNNECTAAGQCCIRLGGPLGFCGDGIPFGDECIPQ